MLNAYFAFSAHLAGLGLVQMHYLRSGWLLEHEFVIGQSFVQLDFYDGNCDVVLFLRPPNLDLRRKIQAVVIFVVFISRVGREISVLIIDKLTMGQQIRPAENDLAGKKPAMVALANDRHFIIGLLHLVLFGVGDDFEAIFHHRDFTLRINLAQDESVINVLRAKIFQRLLDVVGLDIVAADYKPVPGRDP